MVEALMTTQRKCNDDQDLNSQITASVRADVTLRNCGQVDGVDLSQGLDSGTPHVVVSLSPRARTAPWRGQDPASQLAQESPRNLLGSVPGPHPARASAARMARPVRAADDLAEALGALGVAMAETGRLLRPWIRSAASPIVTLRDVPPDDAA